MGILRNKRHERFAQEIANGSHAAFAYVAAGFSDNKSTARSNASRLLAHDVNGPLIRARIDELLSQKSALALRENEAAAEKAGVDKAWVLEKLVENANNCLRLDETGKPMAASAGNMALQLVGKELGMFIDRSEVTMNPDEDIDRMTPEERAAEARRLLAAIGAKAGGLAS